MKDLRFSGTVGAIDVDITFRTDAINAGDGGFNVTQIQVGPQFQVTDESDEDHAALFNDFKKINKDIETFKSFATDNGLELTMADSTGENLEVLVEESSASASASV